MDTAGILWVACAESNCILKVDPETLAIQEFKLPEGGKTRRLAFTSDGMLWYGNDGLGTVGRLNTKTGETKEWPSPSGPASGLYGLEVVNDIVWYNEFRQAPRHAGALRSQDGEVPELANSIRQCLCRYRAPYEGNSKRRSSDPPEQHQSHYAGIDRRRREIDRHSSRPGSALILGQG